MNQDQAAHLRGLSKQNPFGDEKTLFLNVFSSSEGQGKSLFLSQLAYFMASVEHFNIQYIEEVKNALGY